MRAPGGQTEEFAALADLARFPEMNPGPVLRLDSEGFVVVANTAARRLFGSTDLVGAPWIDLCPGMDRPLWQQVLEADAPVTHEAEVGETCVVFTHVRADTGGYVFVFGADITERRRAEQLLAEQAAALAEMARFPDMNPGPVLRLELNGTVRLANAAAGRLFGSALVGCCWLDLCPGLDQAAWRGILAAEEPVGLEARIGDREYLFAHRRDHGGALVFVFGTDVTQQRQQERALRQAQKMATLGTLAAGVAHELNNPAAATRRAAEQLRDAMARLEDTRARLAEACFDAAPRDELRRLEQQVRDRAARADELDSLERSDREAAVEEWLEEHEVEEPWELAPPLVRAGLDPPALERLAPALGEEALPLVLGWTAAAFSVYALLHEIAQGSGRMSEIVRALKSYSYLGQAPVQAVDLHEGINNTLVILRHKLKAGIRVQRDYCADLPPVPAHGSELNQVWTNLLDNAADALGGTGAITIRTRRRDGWAVVEIEDDGPGIPEEAQARIFDPFFTTKPPGKGVGLGLSTSYSIVTEKHHGEIALESRPGLTRFTVRLPLESS